MIPRLAALSIAEMTARISSAFLAGAEFIRFYLRSRQKRINSAPARNADEIRAVISAIDKAAKRGIIHRNAANRRKARLTKALGAAK